MAFLGFVSEGIKQFIPDISPIAQSSAVKPSEDKQGVRTYPK